MGSLDDASKHARNGSHAEGHADGYQEGYGQGRDADHPRGYGFGVRDCRKDALKLVKDKKGEYERATPSTPEGAAERDAVVAALDTLHAHIAAKLSPDDPGKIEGS